MNKSLDVVVSLGIVLYEAMNYNAHNRFMEKETRLVGQERPLLTSQHVDILRFIGRGMAREDIVGG